MITITTDKPGYSPGEEIRVGITVAFRKPVKARGLYATLLCHETHREIKITPLDKYDHDREKELGIPNSTHLRTSTQVHDEIIFEKELKVSGEKEYQNETFEVSFMLPKDAKATSHEYGNDDLINIWKLHAKLDIPMALDKNAEVEIVVNGL